MCVRTPKAALKFCSKFAKLDTHHNSGSAARLGRAALQNLLLELQGALVDVEGVRHDDRWRAHVINVIELYVGMLHNGTAQQS